MPDRKLGLMAAVIRVVSKKTAVFGAHSTFGARNCIGDKCLCTANEVVFPKCFEGGGILRLEPNAELFSLRLGKFTFGLAPYRRNPSTSKIDCEHISNTGAYPYGTSGDGFKPVPTHISGAFGYEWSNKLAV